ncbi:MAG TPA: hypothetical protein VLL54_12745 [Pyrinomonadaceae bacterium]|nr:hypothetical protein [Pyrinomonadaceae bacterium]
MKLRFFVCVAACFFFLLTASFIITSESAGKTKVKKRTRGPRAAATQHVSHCADPDPAHPSNCDIHQAFNAGCPVPWDGAESHDIDENCPNEGCATRESDKAQNRIKNNVCATGTPVEIGFTSIDKLQRAVDLKVQHHELTYGSTGPPQPADRNKLKNLASVDRNNHAITLGEGDLVTLDAFILDAKHDDTFPFGFKGEGVNCKNSLLEWNDIHVALGSSATAHECASATAEIIPHFRSAVWDRIDTNACTVSHVTNPLPVKHLRVRITGQLFFDGSHKPSPCSAPTGGGNPLRRSVWEIHPVYKIEVFDHGAFISLEDFAAHH